MAVTAPTTPTGYKRLFSIVNSASGTDTSQIACCVGTGGCRVISGIAQTVTITVLYCKYPFI